MWGLPVSMTSDVQELPDSKLAAEAPTKPAFAPIAELLPLVQQASEVRRAATPEALLFNYVLVNGAPKERNLLSLMRLFRGAVDLGHTELPLHLKSFCHDRDLLHLYCGQSLNGVAFRALGARTYTGVDENVSLIRKKFRSRVRKETVDLGLSLSDVTRLMPGITFLKSDKIGLSDAFDGVVLQGAHRILDPEATFAQLHRALRPRGQIWLSHDNFYAWGGHQGDPKSPSRYDPQDSAQKAFVDWGHVMFDPPEGHRFRTSLNRLRIVDLRRIVDTYFEVEQWKEVPDRSSIPPRLTPAVRRKLKGFTDQDLLTKQVICRATKRR
jgi:SAM-dependent methyltransferase